MLTLSPPRLGGSAHSHLNLRVCFLCVTLAYILDNFFKYTYLVSNFVFGVQFLLNLPALLKSQILCFSSLRILVDSFPNILHLTHGQAPGLLADAN